MALSTRQLVGDALRSSESRDSLDVVFIGKDNDPASVGGLHQSLDDLFKLARSRLTGNLYGLCDT